MYEELKFIVRQKYEGAYTINEHTHPCYELVYYLKGSGVVEVSDKKFNFRPNTLIITKPNQIHSERSEDSSEVIFVGFSSKTKLPDGMLIDDADCSILNVALNIETEMKGRKNLFRSISDKLLELLILLINRKDGSNIVPEDKIENIMNYIESCANQNITIKQIAHNLGYNVDYLRQLFLEKRGQSPKDYLLECRMRNVKNYLINYNYSIKVIALLTGFSSSSHLCTTFKKMFGVSPIEFMRKEHSDTKRNNLKDVKL